MPARSWILKYGKKVIQSFKSQRSYSIIKLNMLSCESAKNLFLHYKGTSKFGHKKFLANRKYKKNIDWNKEMRYVQKEFFIFFFTRTLKY